MARRRRRLSEDQLILSAVALLWAIEAVNTLIDHQLNALGILPRTPQGLIGIVCAPFLHGNFSHLFVNTLPVLVLAGLVHLGQKKKIIPVTVFIALVGGALVWLLGRGGAHHVGVSGVIVGYFGYLMTRGFLVVKFQTMLIALVTILLYGGLVHSITPGHPGISWESHLFGMIAGSMAAFRYKR